MSEAKLCQVFACGDATATEEGGREGVKGKLPEEDGGGVIFNEVIKHSDLNYFNC